MMKRPVANSPSKVGKFKDRAAVGKNAAMVKPFPKTAVAVSEKTLSKKTNSAASKKI